MTRPLVLIDPWPRVQAMIFTDQTWARLERRAETIAFWGEGRMPDDQVEAHLPSTEIIVGQTHLDAARIARATNLRAVINVKGNWEPHIDYPALAARAIHVLSIAPCMAPAVAEWCLGAAIDLGRGLTTADRAFRAGEERYGIAGNGAARSLFDAEVGLIGFGNLGRALRPLLAPFGCRVRVHDPWLPAGFLGSWGCEAAPLDEILSASEVVFVLAGVTTDNEGFLDRSKLQQIRPDASVILASRAEVVAFDDFVTLAEAGHFRAAIDVFPEEPVDGDHPIRDTDHILLSSHRAGGIWPSYRRIAEWMIDDIEQILDGLPPARLQRAEPALAARMRSR